MTQTLSPEDTGEIRRPDDEVGETTQNLAPVFLELTSYRRPDAAVTGELPAVAWGPTVPTPPPLPPMPRPSTPPRPSADLAAAQPIAPWERVAGAQDTAIVSLLGQFGETTGRYRGRHRLTWRGRLSRLIRGGAR